MYTDWCKSCAGSEKNLRGCMQPRRLTLLSLCDPIQRKKQTCPSGNGSINLAGTCFCFHFNWVA